MILNIERITKLKSRVDSGSGAVIGIETFIVSISTLIGGVAWDPRNCNWDWDTLDAIPKYSKKPLTVEKTCRFFEKRFLNYNCPKMVFGGHRPTRGKNEIYFFTFKF